MQLHHLTLSAIGPFHTEFHVDFGALGASGLFLLEGPTGSGKSTLIDAIVYGLYGKVASKDASDERMRSDHADDNTESFVDLVFETPQGIFRVVRQPQRLRLKKRGTGTIKQQAAVSLWRLSVDDLEQINAAYSRHAKHSDVQDLGVGVLRSTRLDEAGIELTRAIGLDRDQFVQTIVLPQGEFAKFLRAEPESRRKLLQKVFGTEIYERAQDQLAAMKRDADREIAGVKSARRDAVRAFTQAVENPNLDAETLTSQADELLLEVLEGEIERLKDIAEGASDAEFAAATVEAQAKDEYDSAKRVVELFEQKKALLAEQIELEAQREAVELQRSQLATATRASYVTPAALAVKNARLELDGTLRSFVSSIEAAQQFSDLVPVDGDAISTKTSTVAIFATAFEAQRGLLMDQRDNAQRVLGQLAETDKLEQTLAARQHSLETDRSRATDKAKKLEALLASLATRPQEHSALVAERDSLTEVAGQVHALEITAERARELVEKHEGVLVDAARVATETRKVEDAAVELGKASDREHQTRAAWLGQMAAVLAQGLEDGQPCSVCGSIAHPEPAKTDPSVASEEDVEAAEVARRRAQDSLSTCRADLAGAVQRLQAKTEELGGTTKDEAAQQLDDATEQLKRARAAALNVKEKNLAILAQETKTADLKEEEKQLSAEIAALASKIELHAAQLEVDSASVAAQIKEQATDIQRFLASDQVVTIHGISQVLERRSQTIGNLLAALDVYSKAEDALRDREAALKDVVAEHGFDSVEEAMDAARPVSERTQLDQSVKAYDQRQVTVSTQLASEQFAQLPPELRVDLASLRATFDGAQLKHRQMSHLSSTAKKTLVEAQNRKGSIQAVITEFAQATAKVAPILRMADVATGNSADNPNRITLATYVLMRRFEEVVAAANTRLLALSDGRYELERSDEKEDVSSRKTGLALRVIDHETEKPRDPRTLSGGETFNASLSLALGLADVVTAEAGGVELGTLFIDEGFGTLDPEALDKVINVLGVLRDGGRTVGVVSHVETLKQAIPDGISVRRLGNGSSTLTVRA